MSARNRLVYPNKAGRQQHLPVSECGETGRGLNRQTFEKANGKGTSGMEVNDFQAAITYSTEYR